MKCLLLFVLGGLLFGLAALGLGFMFWQESALIQGGTAFGLTFIPVALTLAWALHSYRSSPEMQLLACLGGSGVRMAIALGGAYFLTQAQPEIFSSALFFWLLVFYLTFLAAEISLVLRRQPTPEAPVQR
jgi:hypothetical protein